MDLDLIIYIIDMIQLLTVEDLHFLESARSMALNDTLSNAPSMSRKVPRAMPWLRMALSILLTSLWRAVSVDEPFVNPYCFLFSLEWILRSTSICQSITLSIHLSGTGARVIVL